jgi:phage gpG-like protein
VTGIRGDFAELAALTRSFDRLSTRFVPRLSKQLARTSYALVQVEHLTGDDPDGQPWRPNRRGSFPPLTRTGKLKRGWRMFFGPASFGLRNDTAYAKIQNTGGRTGRNYSTILPARRMVPEGTLGPRWTAEFDGVTQHVFESFFQ